MKVSLVTLLAALSASALAVPLPGHELPEITNAAQLVALLKAHQVGPYAPSAGHGGKGLLGDIGEPLDCLLTVTGQDAKELLIELSPAVAKLLAGLGLPGLGISVGRVVEAAASVGDLVTDLGDPVRQLLTVVGTDVGCLLIELSDPVADLLTDLGLSLGEPVGEVVATLGGALKGSGVHRLSDLHGYVARGAITVPVPAHDDFRGEDWTPPKHTGAKILQATSLKPSKDLVIDGHYIRNSHGKLLADVGHSVRTLLEVVGPDAKRLLIELSPEVAGLLDTLGLDGISEPIGEIIDSAASVGDLLADLGKPVEGLLCVLSDDLGALLIQLSPALDDLLSSLGLNAVGDAVGRVVAVIGDNV